MIHRAIAVVCRHPFALRPAWERQKSGRRRSALRDLAARWESNHALSIPSAAGVHSITLDAAPMFCVQRLLDDLTLLAQLAAVHHGEQGNLAPSPVRTGAGSLESMELGMQWHWCAEVEAGYE